jgi:hypothetical protein
MPLMLCTTLLLLAKEAFWLLRSRFTGGAFLDIFAANVLQTQWLLSNYSLVWSWNLDMCYRRERMYLPEFDISEGEEEEEEEGDYSVGLCYYLLCALILIIIT